IGATIVTTDAVGSVSFSVDLAAAVASGLWITTCVTYLGTTLSSPVLTPGDSSEFSNAVQALPVAIQFVSGTISVDTPGTAVIQVVRTGNTAGTVSVAFASADGTAVAGIDYVATSGTLSFAPGITTQAINVLLLNARIAIGFFAFTTSLSAP